MSLVSDIKPTGLALMSDGTDDEKVMMMMMM